MAMNLALCESDPPGGRAAILSIKPKYASLILAGTKKVELRRTWPSQRIGVLVLYASSPVQKFVGLAYLDKVVECELEELWCISNTHGGGVTYEELRAYLAEKPRAFGAMISRVDVAKTAVDPKRIFRDFTPPQSLSFIRTSDFQTVVQSMFPSEATI
ncbi:putative transcriptional regulator [Achromobacter deleyi]|uniref:ASCH domain-containing protein n=1 Tax=Achromobacter deleyi TaxID=1353891 RepID=UPI00285AEC83|nr:ASCH domain-containing protein [Achromobacter deleyi]MDR6600224.1 putative transcriptional regulator [Achromobacter deleyi]